MADCSTDSQWLGTAFGSHDCTGVHLCSGTSHSAGTTNRHLVCHVQHQILDHDSFGPCIYLITWDANLPSCEKLPVLVSLVMYVCVSRKYTYRVRDWVVNVQWMVEDVFERRMNQEEAYFREQMTNESFSLENLTTPELGRVHSFIED